jgi:hypothetical protein
MYSTRKDKKRPAMTMAEVVPSYPRSPTHSLANIMVAWLYS